MQRVNSSMSNLRVGAFGVFGNLNNVIQVGLVTQTSFESSNLLTDFFEILGL